MGPLGLKGASPLICAHPERDMDSTPAARPTPSSSLRMAWAIEIAPVSEEAQNRLMVTAGTESGNPEARALQRAMSPIPSCAVLTQPAVMSSILSSGAPTFSHAATIVSPRSSSVRMCESEPPYRPTGVRTPPRMNASVISPPYSVSAGLFSLGTRPRRRYLPRSRASTSTQRAIYRLNFSELARSDPVLGVVSRPQISAVELDDLHVTAVGIEKGGEETRRSLFQLRDPGHAHSVQVGHRFPGVLNVEVDHRPDRFKVLVSNFGALVEHEEHAANIERALLALIRGEGFPVPGTQPIRIGTANQNAPIAGVVTLISFELLSRCNPRHRGLLLA